MRKAQMSKNLQLHSNCEIHNEPQGSEEWHALRKGRATGSVAIKLLSGADPKNLNKEEGFKGNFYTARGHLLEKEAVEIFEEAFNVKVHQLGFITNKNYPNAGYSPDGIFDQKVLEIKCFNEKRHNSMQTEADIPAEIIAQVQFGMLICELDGASLLFYNPQAKVKVRHFIIKRAEKIIKRFKEALNG